MAYVQTLAETFSGLSAVERSAGSRLHAHCSAEVLTQDGVQVARQTSLEYTLSLVVPIEVRCFAPAAWGLQLCSLRECCNVPPDDNRRSTPPGLRVQPHRRDRCRSFTSDRPSDGGGWSGSCQGPLRDHPLQSAGEFWRGGE